jgi:hypothetical protein
MEYARNQNSRLLENIVLDFFFVATILKHFAHADRASHATSESSTNFRRMNVLVKFIRIGDTGCVKGFDGANQCPKGGAIGLGNDIVGDSITSSMPSSWNLASNSSAELEGLGNKDTGSLLELGEPLPTLAGPDVALVTMLELEFLCLGVGNLDGLKIMDELDFLVEDFFVGVITAE